MTDNHEKHAWRACLTFRQAEGFDPLPQILKFGEIDQDLRLRLWDAIYSYINRGFAPYEKLLSWQDDFYKLAFEYYRFHKKIESAGAYTLSRQTVKFSEEMKENVLQGDAVDVLNFIQFMLRASYLPDEYKERIRNAFSKNDPYIIHDYDGIPTIIPRSIEAEHSAINLNLDAIAETNFGGAKKHLKKAMDALSSKPEPKYGDVVRESVHAVESAARVITGGPKATLSGALKQIRGKIPTALYEGVQKLYGYAGDEEGVRHSLVEGENERLGLDEAIFAFSICAAVVGFLVRKFPEKA